MSLCIDRSICTQQRTLNSFAIYGFVTWTSTNVILVSLLFWAILPDSILAGLGITYFPDKYWALALSAFANLSFLFILFLGVSWNIYRTPNICSLNTITDPHTRPPVDTDGGSVPILFDVPIVDANAMLGLRRASSDSKLT